MAKQISLEQIKYLITFLPLLDSARHELGNLMSGPADDNDFLKPELAWGCLYDLPIARHLACFIWVAGLKKPLEEAAKSDDPMSALFELDDHPDYQEWHGGEGGLFKQQHLLGTLYSLLGTLESVVLYGFYINELVSMSFDHGDDEALFKAVRIDPVAMTSKKVAHRISVAVVQDDRPFLHKLQAAMKGRTGKQARYLKKFRFLMQLLLESEMLHQPNKDIRSIAIEIGAYSDDPSAEKNLNEQIRKFRRKKPPQMPI